MKKVIFLVMFLPLQATCQIVENFESGNLQNWVFNLADRWGAGINSLSGNFSLCHIFDNSEAGTDQAGIRIDSLHPDEDTTRWSFLVRHGCDPSSSNYWAVFLMSDSEPASMIAGAGMNGYAAGVNLTGFDDTLRLWKINGTSITVVATGNINWQNDIGVNSAVRIETERSPEGKWIMSVSGTDGAAIDSCKGFDKDLFGQVWFGIFYKYSSTRDRLLWLDDISIDGCFYEDREAPVVSSLKVSGPGSVEVTFSEELSASSLQSGNFSIVASGKEPVAVTKKSSLTYRIYFAENFINKSLNNLYIKAICDKSGNCSGNIIMPFIPVFPEPGDVVITEIMPDPFPVVSLPPAEYLEFTNRTEYDFNLKDWILAMENRIERLPEVLIRPKSRLIVCSVNDTAAFKKYGPVAGLKQFYSLSDSHMTLSLSDSTGNLIHGIEYDSKWTGSQLKASGGWSLEMVDNMFPFYEEGNWTSSDSRAGGTPGNENSVSGKNPDEYFKGILNVFTLDSVSIIAKFSEYAPGIDSSQDFLVDNGNTISGISPDCQLKKSFLLKTAEPLLPKIAYRLEVAGNITDFAGNMIVKDGFDFGIPEPPERSDILFNELLFNPLPGDPDYIELFNNSDKILDASRLYLAAVNRGTGDTSAIVQLSEEPGCIMPGSYYTVTTDRNRIIDRYFSSDAEFIYEVTSIPSMNDESGHLILLSRELDIIDEVIYDAEMHYSLLEKTEGIALEKIAQDNPSAGYSLWHSASESSGWGTPGARNSADIQFFQKTEEVTFSSTKITPDNDGYEDVLLIGLSSKENGNVVTATIFDETGRLVRRLTDRLLSAPEEAIVWDGSADDGTLVRTGIYIVLIEMYNASGKVKKWKKVCSVIR